MSVTVGWIDNGNTRGEFTEAVTRLAAYETAKGRLVSVLRVQAGPLVEVGRNKLVEQFLQTGADWLMMVDTDMVFDYDSVERLLRLADVDTAPVVGGLCFGVNQELGQFPTIYKQVDGQPQVQRTVPDHPVIVDATGAAFLLTHRTIFETFRRDDYAPWFHRRFVPDTDVHEGGWLGEDISWCFHLTDKGVHVWVDPAVEAGHIKPVVVGTGTYATH